MIKGTFCLACWDCQKAFKEVGGLSFLSQLKLDRSQFWKLGTGRVSYGPFLSRPLSCHSTFVLHLHTRCCWNWYPSTRLLEVYSPSKVWVVAIFSVGPDVSPVSCLIYRNYRRNGSTSRVGQIFPHYENLDNIDGMFSTILAKSIYVFAVFSLGMQKVEKWDLCTAEKRKSWEFRLKIQFGGKKAEVAGSASRVDGFLFENPIFDAAADLSRIGAGSKWTAGGCTFAKDHKNNYLKG